MHRHEMRANNFCLKHMITSHFSSTFDKHPNLKRRNRWRKTYIYNIYGPNFLFNVIEYNYLVILNFSNHTKQQTLFWTMPDLVTRLRQSSIQRSMVNKSFFSAFSYADCIHSYSKHNRSNEIRANNNRQGHPITTFDMPHFIICNYNKQDKHSNPEIWQYKQKHMPHPSSSPCQIPVLI